MQIEYLNKAASVSALVTLYVYCTEKASENRLILPAPFSPTLIFFLSAAHKDANRHKIEVITATQTIQSTERIN